MREGEEDGPLEADWGERAERFKEAQDEAKARVRLRGDIQTALTVIGRRSAHQRRLEAGRGEEAAFVFDRPYPEHDEEAEDHVMALEAFQAKRAEWDKAASDYKGYRLDLRGANLRGADLSGLNFNGARLEDAHLQGANLFQTQLRGADLVRAQMQGAVLLKAQMQGAGFWWAQMQATTLVTAGVRGADLHGARMQGVQLIEAQMHGANLTKAQMQGANLWGARMQGANLVVVTTNTNTDLREAVLQGAALKGVDLTGVPEIVGHLRDMFGDGSVILPEGV